MATCKYCGTKGLFLRLSPAGLCQRCSVEYASILSQVGRIIDESIAIISSSKKLDTVLSRIGVIKDKAALLLPYERKGIDTYIKPKPSVIIKQSSEWTTAAIIEFTEDTIGNALLKSDAAKTPSGKVSPLVKAIVKIREQEHHLPNPEDISVYVEQLETRIHELQLGDLLDKARKAEFKKQNSKALGHYYEALYFLRNDDIPDTEQVEQIKSIEAKIVELGGSPD